MTTVRLAHFSDIHLTANPLGWQLRDWFNKRLTGWMNLRLLGRSKRFRRAEDTIAALMAELRERRPDAVVFSGDATALGFPTECERAAALLGLHDPQALPGVAVPGNHDYYTAAAARSGAFERQFAPWLHGERVDDETYPFARRVGHVWLVCMNSSRPNRGFWDASGEVGAAQRERLKRLLQRLEPGPRILVTHYPVALSSGLRERRSHGLADLDEVLAVANEGGVVLWLHGHRHGAYRLVDASVAPFPVICAGSVTEEYRGSYAEYIIDGDRLQGTRRQFDFSLSRFVDAESFSMELTKSSIR
jgi:3',5'-cyclic AMP phosphodiesterase CpdA